MKDFALIEMLFSFGVVLALAVWELWRTPRPDDPEQASGSGADGVDDQDSSK